MNSERLVSIICEYNPFHFGHLHQLKLLQNDFDGIVCILSGDIVQRGTPAVASKYLRAEAALRSGANLVLELPIPYSCASARDFAAAGVHIAECVGSDHLAFGAEDPGLLFEIAGQASSESFAEELKTLIDERKNLSYPAAFSMLIGEKLGEDAEKASQKPNNILSLEYLAAMRGKRIKPFVVERKRNLLSSSQIRAIADEKTMLGELPEQSRKVFCGSAGLDFPRDPKRLDPYYIGTLRSLVSASVGEDLYSAPRDLINKAIAASLRVSTVEELVAACVDRNYTAARVRRAVNSLVFGIKTEAVGRLPPYTCVLAADSKGRGILRGIKNENRIEIVTKPVSAYEKSVDTRNAFALSKRIEDIIALSAPNGGEVFKGKSPKVID